MILPVLPLWLTLTLNTYWKQDIRYFAQANLEKLPVNHAYCQLANANAADKLLRMNYDIHVEAVFGLPVK